MGQESARDLTSIISFNPHGNPVGKMFLSPILQKGVLPEVKSLGQGHTGSGDGEADSKVCALDFCAAICKAVWSTCLRLST